MLKESTWTWKILTLTSAEKVTVSVLYWYEKLPSNIYIAPIFGKLPGASKKGPGKSFLFNFQWLCSSVHGIQPSRERDDATCCRGPAVRTVRRVATVENVYEAIKVMRWRKGARPACVPTLPLCILALFCCSSRQKKSTTPRIPEWSLTSVLTGPDSA